MSKYNEPWYATQPEQCGGWWVISKHSNGDDSVDESGDGGFEEETAKRIVACVNVCEGIPTVQLECGNVEFVNIFNERNALRQRVTTHAKQVVMLRDAIAKAHIVDGQDAINEALDRIDLSGLCICHAKPAWYHKHWGVGDDIFYGPNDIRPDGCVPLHIASGDDKNE